MTIEVRQMLIRAVVDDSAPGPSPLHLGPPGAATLPRAEVDRLRAQLLAECKTWLAEQLRSREER